MNTQGGEVRTNGGKVATSGGEINTGFGNIKTVGGDILTAGGKLNTSGGDIVAGTGNISGQNITASGVLSGDSLTVAKGMTGHNLTLTGGDLDAGAGTIKTTGEVDAGTLNVSGKATVKDLEVQGEFNAKTLSSKLDKNNYTEIHGGNVTSVNSKVDTTDGKTYTSTSTLTEKGKTETASNGINRNVEKMNATESSNVITNDANGKTSTFEQHVDEILNQINSSDTVFSKVDQKVDNITSEVTDGTNTTSSTQTTTDITNTATNGTISNNAKELTNTASDSITNKAENGNISNIASNGTISNEAKNKITNKAIDVETDASSSIVSKVSNEYGSNTSTQLSYQTKEEMSQVDGKTASYLRGAAEEKSQLTDGDKKTTIDTIAGQTNTTVVNQDAMSLASSITDGTKANNTNSTVDKSEQLIKASDTQYSATTKTEDALVNGSTLIDIVKDSTTGMVSSAVTDGNTSTGISQSAKDISLSAAGGTIANAAQNITNTASESITNTVGKTTVTTTDSGITFENTDHNTAIKEGTVTKTTISGNTIETGQATMDYADVMKDLGVYGNATVDQKLTVKGDSDLQGNANVGKNLTVNGTSDLKGDVTMESNATVEKDLTVEGTTKTEKLVVNNGATVTGGTTTDTLHVTSTSTFDGQATFKDIVTMEKDLSVGGYKGETATAIGAFYRPNENVMVNVSSSFGTGENMYGGGISLRIGQGGNKARRNATNGLTEREKAQQKQIDYLTSRLDALLSVINPNMSKDFPDVPENHWAYEAVSKLAGNGIIQGYEDGKYHGERTMTRYEMAEIIYNALSKGAKAEKKLVEEFKPEIQAMAAQKKA